MITRELILGGTDFCVEVPPALADKHAPSYSYRTECVEGQNGYPPTTYVRVLEGDKWVYVGRIDDYTAQVVPTKATRWPSTSFRLRLLNRLLPRIWSGDSEAWERFGFKVCLLVAAGLSDEPDFDASLEANWKERSGS